MPWPQTGATFNHVQLRLQLVVRLGFYERDVSEDMGKVRGSGPLLWSGGLSSSSTATPHRNIT